VVICQDLDGSVHLLDLLAEGCDLLEHG
jgi:hypothetical protein